MDCSSDTAEPSPKKLKLEIPEGVQKFNQLSSSPQICLNFSINAIKRLLTSDSLDVAHDLADNLSVIRLNERETLVINAPTYIINEWSIDNIPCLEIFARDYTKQQILCQWTSTLLAALRHIPYCAVNIKIFADEPRAVVCPTNSLIFLRCKLWRFLLNYKSFMPLYLCRFLEAEFVQPANARPNSKVPSDISSQPLRTPHHICNKVTDTLS